MLTVVCWKWGRKYSRQHVYNLRGAVTRHLRLPFRFVAITDDDGLDCERLPMPAAPVGAIKESIRLWLFSPEADTLGHRVLNLDLDMVVIGDITPLATRREPFVIWKSESRGRLGYALNPSLMLFDTGTLTPIWSAFCADATGAMARAHDFGFTGTEQAVIGYAFANRPVPTWTEADGIISFRDLADKSRVPAGSRIVSFHGNHDPAMRAPAPWVMANWHA